jgi:hypothetical protein
LRRLILIPFHEDVGVSAATFLEADAAVEIDSQIVVEDPQLDGNPAGAGAGAGAFDCLSQNERADTAALELGQDDEFADVDAVRMLLNGRVATGNTIALEDLELRGRPSRFEKPVLKRLVPPSELAHHDIVVSRVMGAAGKLSVRG